MQMCPDTMIVPSPCSRILLCAAITSSSNHKRTFSCQFTKRCIGCPGHIMSIYIMHFPMITFSLLIVENYIFRYFTSKTCRLIHICPYSCNPVFNQKFVMISPPFTYFPSPKIWIYRISWPHNIFIEITVRRFGKIIFFVTFIINCITLFSFNTWINNGNESNSIFAKIFC